MLPDFYEQLKHMRMKMCVPFLLHELLETYKVRGVMYDKLFEKLSAFM